jgi:hypothetical protein
MSIAEQIMSGTQRQEKSWSVLSENLGRLGQQVGQQLAMREYQKQAAEALPVIQQQMQTALRDAGEGRSADAYSKLVPLISNPAYNQNPILLPGLEYIMKATKDAAEDARLRFSYGLREGAAGGLPAVDASAYGFRNTAGNDSEPAVVTNPNQMQPQNQSGMDAIMNPEGTPIEGGLPQRPGFDPSQESDLSIPEPAMTRQGAQPQATPAVVAGQKNFQDVTSLPVNEQRNAAMSYGVSEVNPEQYEVVKIAGLEKYLPEFEGFAVPKESWKETSASRSGKGEVSVQTKLTAPEARENFTKRSSNPEERGTKQNVEAAIESMKDKEMVKLFNDFDKDIYALRASTGSQPDKNNQPLFTVTGIDGNKVKITKDQYVAIQTISGIVPATSENAGGTPAIFRPKKKTDMEFVAMAKQELGYPKNATKEQVIARAKELASQQE